MPANPRDEKLLKAIRERYTYLADCWREARDERATDLKFVAGDPWTDAERKARKDRPTINHDELGQYVNACVNSMRQNPRAIKIDPAGNGASEKSAELREGLIRAVEYKSRARSIYLQAYQDMVEGSYGFFRIGRRYVSDDSFDQEIVIRAVVNPDSILYDWDVKEPDWSDAEDCFELEPLTREEFKRRWPNAEVKDFTSDDMRVAKDWIQEKMVLTAGYWRIERQPGKLHLLASGDLVSDLPEGEKPVKSRAVERKTLVQYWTNGIEILERTEQPGTLLPIIPVVGLQRFILDGATAKRKLFSLVRLARDPQKSHAYLCSQEMEEAGLTPKSPYKGYVGQFETDREAWETATKIPHAFLQADPMVDGATGQVLPLPVREQFTPNFQSYEIAKDSARRAIQAAMGVSPLPTAAQRQNEKSGIALERIQDQQEIGSFHFVDGYDRALELAGRVIEGWIAPTYDTEREAVLSKLDDSHQIVRLNTEEPYVDPKTNTAEHFPVIDDGDHQVTISTGPSMQSQREAASDFLDTLLKNLQALPIPPPAQAKLLALAIKMKQLGPKGDEMASIIAPEDGQNAMAAAQQAQIQAQQMQQALAEMQAELNQLRLEKAGKVIDNQFKLQIEKMREENQLAIAEVSTKAQQISERLQTFTDMMKQFHDQAHDIGMLQQEHANTLAQQSQQAALTPPQPEGPSAEPS